MSVFQQINRFRSKLRCSGALLRRYGAGIFRYLGLYSDSMLCFSLHCNKFGKQPNKLLIGSLLLLVSSMDRVYAFPRGCELRGFAYQQNHLLINDTGKQSFYLIQNRSDTKIGLERLIDDEVLIEPPLQAKLDPMKWGAFAVDIKNLNFKCYKYFEDDTQDVDCREVLEICQYPRAKFAPSNRGNYWIAFNKPQEAIIQESVAKGIYLKW